MNPRLIKDSSLTSIEVRGKPLIRPTSDRQLCTAVKQVAKDPKRSRTLVIVISGLIPEIYLAIGGNVDCLHIVRVNNLDPEGDLLVDGASSWNGTRLDEWPKRSHRRKLFYPCQ